MIRPSTLDLTAFCALAAMGETQQVALSAMEAIEGADPEAVFAETLCLVSTATSRAAASALHPGDEARRHLSEALMALPLTMHSYVAGSEVLRHDLESPDAVPDNTPQLERMLDFYGTHIQDTGMPDKKALRHVAILWMGRISPPGLGEHPEARVQRIGVIERLSAHVRLVEAFARSTLA